MIDLKNNAARIALATLLAAAPLSALAQVESGSPSQSVAEDPDEGAEETGTAGQSLKVTPKAVDTEEAYGDDARTQGDVEGSLVEDDAKADD